MRFRARVKPTQGVSVRRTQQRAASACRGRVHTHILCLVRRRELFQSLCQKYICICFCIYPYIHKYLSHFTNKRSFVLLFPPPATRDREVMSRGVPCCFAGAPLPCPAGSRWAWCEALGAPRLVPESSQLWVEREFVPRAEPRGASTFPAGGGGSAAAAGVWVDAPLYR